MQHRAALKLNKIFPFKVFPMTDFSKTLGRWSTNNTKEQTDHRIDWSNEDHCGACGDLIKQRTESCAKNDTKTNNPE